MNKRIRKKQGREYTDMTGWNAPAWRGWFTRWSRASHPLRVADKNRERWWRNNALAGICGVRKMPWNKLAMHSVAPWEQRRVEAARRRVERRCWRAARRGTPRLSTAKRSFLVLSDAAVKRLLQDLQSLSDFIGQRAPERAFSRK